jgi:hypothetical protein
MRWLMWEDHVERGDVDAVGADHKAFLDLMAHGLSIALAVNIEASKQPRKNTKTKQPKKASKS